MSKLAAIVLAAGVSSRMAKFKPMLPIDGQTMAQRVVRAMETAGADPVIVVTGYRGAELEAHLAGTGARFIRNETYYRTQMLDSLLLGAEALPAEAERVLVCPADIPLVKPETVAALLSVEGAFVRPVCGGEAGHPVVVSRALVDGIRGYTGKGGLRGAVEAMGVAFTDVEVEDRGATLDGDTRDEYARLLRYRREQTGRVQPLQLDLVVRLQAESAFWGPGSAQFLELIQTTGSILSACQCMHMSYSKGWSMLNEAERQLGCPLLVRSQGGSNGGGSELTPAAKALLGSYRKLQEELQARGQELFEEYFSHWGNIEEES